MNNAEEIVNLEGIEEKYEEKGFFRRIADMSAGLGMPRDSREYKLARIELQRLAAPLIAVVSVSLFVVALAVITAVSGQEKKKIDITIAHLEEDVPPIEQPPEVTPDDPVPQDPVEVEIVVDTPTPGPMTELTPQPSPPSSQATVKPAPQNAVMDVPSPVKMKSVFAGRTTGTIGSVTCGGPNGGDPTTEACVLKVLWWLKKNQNTEGSWSGGNKLANTALATLTYLAHGEYPGAQSPYAKDFGPVVQQALDYLIGCVDQKGGTVKMNGADGNEYAFLMATYALCEAYGMTKNPNCKDVAEACLDRIVRGQSSTGGWDYKINPQSTRDDMSFAGWALQALKAGKMAGIHPEGLDECIKKAVRCLKTRNFKNGGFNYVAGGNPTGLTATGCLAMQLLGYGNQPEVASALDYMREWNPSFDAADVCAAKSPGGSPQYYCYYATQCKYQAGMKQGAKKNDEMAWQKWNLAMKKYYPSVIIDDPEMVPDWTGKGHKQGHFENRDAHTSRPTMDTCLAALQLMVYYRYLPTTQTKAGATVDEQQVGSVAAVDNGGDVGIDVDI